MKRNLFLVVLILTISFYNFSCTGGINSGSLSPNLAYQTVNTQNGRYYTVNVINCTQYEFTFCTGGAVSGIDSQLTLLNSSGTTEIVYSDDFCSTNASIIWTANFTGTVQILISKFNCNHDLSSNVTLAYRMVSSSGGNCFTVSGSASNTTIGGQPCVQLTPELNNQTGCAWNSNALNFNTSFNLSMNAYFGNNINGADGTTFVFQPNPSSPCGQIGGQLGAGGLPNSLIVEFDTYDNDYPTHTYDMSQDHVAIEIDGNLQGPGAPYCGPVSALSSGAPLDDGFSHTISIDWNATTQTLTVFVDGNLRLSCNGNFVSTVFGGNSTVYWGASASTGGLNNQQYFCSSYIALPTELKNFFSVCNGDNEFVTWELENEQNFSEYILELSYDGVVFETYRTFEKSLSNMGIYKIQVDNTILQEVYFRLVMVDHDGNRKYSDLINSKNCHLNNELLASYNVTNNDLSLFFTNERNYFQIIDVSGKKVSEVLYTDSGVYTLIKPSTGMYIVKMWNSSNSKFDIKRIFIK